VLSINMDIFELEQCSDAELLVYIQQDNRFAFNELFKRHWSNLLDSAYKRLKVKEIAEELVQEVFLNLYLKRHTLVITTSVAAFLHTVLKYKVLDEIRANLVRRNYKEEWLSRPSIQSEDAHTLLENKELSELIISLSDKLAPKCKEVFLLKHQQQLSNKKIAEQLQIAEKTVEGHISTARKTLKLLLKDYKTDFLTVLLLLQVIK
jgi:RNA polymerase sigma-70 factor (family 1)